MSEQFFTVSHFMQGGKLHIFLAGMTFCGRSNERSRPGNRTNAKELNYILDPRGGGDGPYYCAVCARAFLKGYAAQGMVEAQRQESNDD